MLYIRLRNAISSTAEMKIGDWVLIYFPSEDSGKQHKLSCPWHGPYHVVSKDATDVTAVKAYVLSEEYHEP